jgi:hypothetical protein
MEFEMTNTDYNSLIDTARLEKANSDLAALQLAARDAEAAVSAAEADTASAHAAAQKAADGGANVDRLLTLEASVEDAERKLSVARRMSMGAKTRRDAGAQTHANEVKQSHGAALNAAMGRFIGLRSDAKAVFDELEKLKAEHAAVRRSFLAIANVAGAGVPDVIRNNDDLLGKVDGKLMADSEFDNRLSQRQHHEWDVAAGKLRWTVES